MSQQPTIADEYFTLAHEPETGHPRLHATPLGLGLAAGLLCELVVGGWIAVSGGAVSARRHGEVPVEPLRHRIHDLILGESAHWPVDVWLRYLAPDARDLVGDRLVISRRYQRDTVRTGLLRRSVRRYRPVDPALAAYSVVRLGNALRSRQLSLQDAVVVALAVATDLTDAIDLTGGPVPRDLSPALAHLLPEPVREVIAHTEACVAQHVMTP